MRKTQRIKSNNNLEKWKIHLQDCHHVPLKFKNWKRTHLIIENILGQLILTIGHPTIEMNDKQLESKAKHLMNFCKLSKSHYKTHKNCKLFYLLPWKFRKSIKKADIFERAQQQWMILRKKKHWKSLRVAVLHI